jgi:hypothetical protein
MAQFARGAALALALTVAASASVAASIYNANVETRLKLDPSQRSQVQAITQKSWSDTLAVFKKYGIDPNAPPEFNRLVKAANELQAIEKRERNEMKKILTPDQLDQYDDIIERTHIVVRKAAQAEGGQKGRR